MILQASLGQSSNVKEMKLKSQLKISNHDESGTEMIKKH